jgi:hypothetical protein
MVLNEKKRKERSNNTIDYDANYTSNWRMVLYEKVDGEKK